MLHTKVFHSVLDFLGSMSPPLVAYFRVFQNPVRDTFFFKVTILVSNWAVVAQQRASVEMGRFGGCSSNSDSEKYDMQED
jgi:hypothetical protein